MKIQCDVCSAEPASIFCCADEAALCSPCDRRVHTANKLAGKHRRLSLSSSPLQSPPLCDICREKSGFIFCQEDRAILCKDCDESIHCVNELTKKHSRFLLSSSLRLSSASMPEPTTTTSSASTDANDHSNKNNTNSFSNSNSSSSSISEYLMKTLPGWRVEDLLEETMDHYFPMEKSVEEELPIWQALQVPQAPQSKLPIHVFNLGLMETVSCNNFEFPAKSGRPEKRRSDDVFRVPQIPTVNVENHKRSRTLHTKSSSSMPPSSSFWYY